MTHSWYKQANEAAEKTIEDVSEQKEEERTTCWKNLRKTSYVPSKLRIRSEEMAHIGDWSRYERVKATSGAWNGRSICREARQKKGGSARAKRQTIRPRHAVLSKMIREETRTLMKPPVCGRIGS